MRNTALFASMLGFLIWAPPGNAQVPGEPNHAEIPNVDPPDLVSMFKLQELRTMGLSVFSTPFNKKDGLGDGEFDPAEVNSIVFGHRPTLQGNGTFLRVNGLDAQSCNECHGFVRHSTRPPVLGIGGVGGAATNAIIMPSLIDVADSFDDRVSHQLGHDPDLPLVEDGVADYNGRFANPPFLFGGGGVELLAKEMTVQLQVALEVCASQPGTPVELQTDPGTDFGTIVCAADGTVDLSGTEGIVPREDVSVLTSVPMKEASELLVVRPFGRKGENFSMRDFDRGATQFHFGIQPVEVVGANTDEDDDGVENEVTVAEMTALHIFDVTNPRPIMEKLDARAKAGFQTFHDIGCADCHTPEMTTESRFLPLAHPEDATDPWADVYLEIDLRKQVGKTQKEGFQQKGTGVVVPLFSDLKRHDMGPRLAETFERGEIDRQFITARLWGIGDTEPYLHDARATTLYEAIEFHGGEAQEARDLFVDGLKPRHQRDLIHFLKHLRTPDNPNSDIAKTLSGQ